MRYLLTLALIGLVSGCHSNSGINSDARENGIRGSTSLSQVSGPFGVKALNPDGSARRMVAILANNYCSGLGLQLPKIHDVMNYELSRGAMGFTPTAYPNVPYSDPRVQAESDSFKQKGYSTVFQNEEYVRPDALHDPHAFIESYFSSEGYSRPIGSNSETIWVYPIFSGVDVPIFNFDGTLVDTKGGQNIATAGVQCKDVGTGAAGTSPIPELNGIWVSSCYAYPSGGTYQVVSRFWKNNFGIVFMRSGNGDCAGALDVAGITGTYALKDSNPDGSKSIVYKITTSSMPQNPPGIVQSKISVGIGKMSLDPAGLDTNHMTALGGQMAQLFQPQQIVPPYSPPTADLKTLCLASVNKDATRCEQIQDSDLRFMCKGGKPGNDRYDCAYIQNVDLRITCSAEIGGDLTTCSAVGTRDMGNLCAGSLNVSHPEGFCAAIQNANLRNFCLATTLWGGGPSLCAQIQ
jgi:hypothetical protein